MAIETARRVLARVRSVREARDLTQELFAEKAGMTYKYYQSLEAGRKENFTMATLQKLARACGLEPWELLHPDASAAAVGEGPQAKYDAGSTRKKRKG